ncbi:transcription termination/antitermination NusG family protein [Endozoicomonas sp. YOMI1]|uniref:transcription termination/antitermination NusG family protein n=1 Tax=Endozoicomonas sp. YOMI1 TaxID=2828739 RepID=UPI0021478BE3|nr:transcription termination/antitermination NusG family protein [Endozoicomonas sp. YOMI1]
MSFEKAALKQGWYLLKAKSREEIRARDNLENQGFEAYCPLIQEKSTCTPLFPGYLFIRLSKKDLPSFHKIRSTRGIAQVVRFNRTSYKLYNEGRLPKEDLGKLLPSPIPDGDQLIDQIEAFVWKHNGRIPDEKPDSVSFTEGESVLYNNPLFRHLESTFVKGVKMDRGIILIQFIESQRTDEGIEEKIVARKEVEVPLKDLQKVPEES